MDNQSINVLQSSWIFALLESKNLNLCARWIVLVWPITRTERERDLFCQRLLLLPLIFSVAVRNLHKNHQYFKSSSVLM